MKVMDVAADVRVWERSGMKIPNTFLGPLIFLLPALVALGVLVIYGHIAPWPAFAVAALIVAGSGVWLSRQEEQVRDVRVQAIDTAVATTILDALPDPVLLLDGKRRIIAANQSADDMFDGPVRDRDFAASLRHPEALKAIDDVLSGTKMQMVEIGLSVPVPHTLEMHAVAVAPGAAGAARAMVAFHDITLAKNAQQMRADFVANVSHELRSPLSTLVGFIETLANSARDDPEARERFLGIMDDEARRMARLIDDLLSLSKVETNEHIRPASQIAVAHVIGGVIDALSVKARNRKIEIRRDGLEDLPTVLGDDDELTEVFTNLLDNAIKYTSEGSQVTVHAALCDRIPDIGGPGLCIEISDTGEGISSEHIPRLTERFYRIDKGRSREMGGTGLGLAIVKHIVSRHRGRFAITSQVGQGSTFTVYLPIGGKSLS